MSVSSVRVGGVRHYLSGYPLQVALVFLGCLFSFSLVWSSSTYAANWLHFGYDSQYTGYNSVENTINGSNVADLKRTWGIGCDDGWFSVISASPAIWNGKLYTSGAGSKLTTYDAQTGQQLWNFGSGNAGWAPQPVVSQDGIVFYMEGSYPTQLYAVNANSGAKLWEAPLAFDMGYNDTALATVDEPNGLVYIVENPFMGGGKLFVLDKRTGEIKWYKSKATDGLDFKGDNVLIANGKIFIPGQDEDYHEHMVRIDIPTQNIDLTYDGLDTEQGREIDRYVLCNSKLMVTYSDRAVVVAYNIDSKSIVWQNTYSSTQITGKMACNRDKNIVYVPTDPYLYALDVSTGQEIWRHLGYGPIYNPSIANGLIYYISDSNMYALDETTGNKVFAYPLGYKGYETSQVAINDGMLYFSGNGGTCDLYALGFKGPSTLPTVSIEATDPYAWEQGKETGSVQISRTGDTGAALTVSYTATGSAKNGIDFKKLSGKATISAGATSVTIKVKPIDDRIREKPEKVKVKLVSDPGYLVGSPANATVTINDND